jgi:hypothetical protein
MKKLLSWIQTPIFLLSFSISTQLFSAEILPMALESSDPAKPLIILDDRTWSGTDVQIAPGQLHSFPLSQFRHDGSNGPITLVLDYAATRVGNEEGEALFDVGVECFTDQSSDGCPIPIAKSVMGVRSNLMGESVAIINGKPEPVWVARVSQTYFLPPNSSVSVFLTQSQRANLDPKALRLRLVYGDYDRTALPGQKTRTGIFFKITTAVLLILAGFLWWVRRQ